MKMIMYHGSRQPSPEFVPGFCLTEDADAAFRYGRHVTQYDLDESRLTVKTIEMTDAEMRTAIDDQEWPCDRAKDIAATIAEGYDAVRYLDCDENGRTHSCLRILTSVVFEGARQ